MSTPFPPPEPQGQPPFGHVPPPAPAPDTALPAQPSPDPNGAPDPAHPTPEFTLGTSPAPGAPPPDDVISSSGDFTDGQWHRLHPATPLLRGGVALVAIFAIVVGNLREQLINFFLPQEDFCGDDEPYCGPTDPIAELVESGNIIIVLAVLAAVLLLAILGFWFSWRMHAFRVSDERLEVKSGILFRTHRQGRLDRIQGINISRPFLARLVGTARLEITVAGDDANIQLAYLSSANADALRAEILRLASGARRAKEPAAPVPAAPPAGEAGIGGILEQRIQELTAPELDPSLAEPTSVVHMEPGRLIASTLLNTMAWLLLFPPMVAIPLVIGVLVEDEEWEVIIPVLLGTGLPLLFAMVSYAVSKIVKSLRFTIAGTPDGVRVGFGLLSTSNETLPPGRIHSISITQSILWRPFDWWEVKVNRAGMSSAQGAAGQKNTTILPVGTREDAFRVIQLVLPALERPELHDLVLGGLAPGGEGDGYTTSPQRAAVLRWFSWRRNGFALSQDAIFLRRGAIWRELVILPTARMQSVALRQGPLLRRLDLAAVHPHTVSGPVSTALGALDAADAESFFQLASIISVEAARADRTQRWGESARTEESESAQPGPGAPAAAPPAAPVSPAVPPASSFPPPAFPQATPEFPPPAFPQAPPAVPPVASPQVPPLVPPREDDQQ